MDYCIVDLTTERVFESYKLLFRDHLVRNIFNGQIWAGWCNIWNSQWECLESSKWTPWSKICSLGQIWTAGTADVKSEGVHEFI